MINRSIAIKTSLDVIVLKLLKNPDIIRLY